MITANSDTGTVLTLGGTQSAFVKWMNKLNKYD